MIWRLLVAWLLFYGVAAAQTPSGLLLGVANAATSSYTGPCDTSVTGQTCGWFWGFVGYKRGYTGKAMQIERASDSTTKDIYILSNGQFDVATAESFCSGTTCSVSIAYDQTAGSVCTGTNYTGNSTCDGTTGDSQPPLVFNCEGSVPCWTTPTSSSTAADRETPIGNDYPAPTGVVSLATCVEFENSNSGTAAKNNSDGLTNGIDHRAGVANSLRLYAGSVAAFTAADAAWHAIVAVYDGSSSVANVDGTETTLNPGGPSTATGIVIAGYGGSSSGNATNFIAGMSFTDGTVLTSGQRAALQTSLQSVCGVP
jgi:Alpha-L-arabinofuranosidase B, catalytic